MSDTETLVTEFAGDMPPVSPQIAAALSGPDTALPEVKPAVAISAGDLDSEGMPFNPDKHYVDKKTGQRVKTKDGRWRDKGGRPGTQKAAPGTRPAPKLILPANDGGSSPLPPSQPETLPETAPAPQPLDPAVYKKMGEITAGMIFTAGMLFFGEDGKPITDESLGLDEPNQMAEAWAVYYQATGATQISPGAMVLMVTGQYAAIRLARPKPLERLGMLYHRVMGFFRRR